MSESTYSGSINRISLRSILIGLAFVVMLCAITPYNNLYLHNSGISTNHLPVGSVFALLILILAIIFGSLA